MPLTRLERTRVSDVYRRRLAAGLEALIEFLARDSTGVDVLTLFRDPSAIDAALARFVQHCFDACQGFGTAKHAVLAVQTEAREPRGKLTRAWDSLKSRRLQLPLRHRVPIPEDVLLYAFVGALDLALRSSVQRGRLVCLAVLIRVGFYALLRPGELIGLRAGDVRLGRPGQTDPIAIVALRGPKNRAALGRAQFTLARDVGTVRWLEWLVSDMAPEQRLWMGDAGAFRQCFKSLMHTPGLSDLGLSLASLRPGGTAWLFLQGQDVARLQRQGRWRSALSLSCYIQEVMAQLVWLSVSVNLESRISAALSSAQFAIVAPPSFRWSLLFSRARQWHSLQRKKSRRHFTMGRRG